MTLNSNEPRRVRGAGGRGKSTAGSVPKVPQAKPETEPAAIIADYWHEAKTRYKRGDYVDYGSPAWCALPLEDPRKMAGLVAFAQLWLRYGDEIAEDLNQQLAAPAELWQRATTEACDLAVRQIRAQQERSRKEAA